MESFQSVGKSLPSKEASMIKQVARLVDGKKFSKALKKIDKVLASFPDDGESLSLKASILNSLGKKDEALPMPKQGVMKKLKGPLSWHLLSQVYYSEKNYTEAYKAEQKAINLAPSNNTIMRSLSLLQLHTRDFMAFRDSRKQILISNFTGLMNWMSYAVAEYFCGYLDRTISVLDSFLKTMEKHISNQELSETLLFKARVLGEMEKYAEMLEFLETNKAKIKDTPTWEEYTVKAAIGCKNFEVALKHIFDLLKLNSENAEYFRWYFEAKEYKTPQEKIKGLEELKELYPQSVASERESLNYLNDEILLKFDGYFKKKIRKGIPSLFSDVKNLLSLQPRGDIITEYTRMNVESLKSSKSFIDPLTKNPSAAIEQPQCLLWLMFFYSQLLDSYKKHEEALDYISQAIEHTPTLPDLYLVKGKILKHMGNYDKAAETVQEARGLDLGDRYLNNKAAKYLLRNNQIQEAENVMALFSKEKANELNVHDMQSMWYELELAQAYFRLENYSKSAEEFRWIEKHLTEMFEDQYDFHFYCYRKMNLNSYIDFMRFEDSLVKNENFLRSGIGLAKIFFKDNNVVPINESSRILKILLKHHPNCKELNVLGFRTFLLREKYLIALRCLVKLENTEEYSGFREELAKKIQDAEMKEPVQKVITRVFNR